MQRQNEGHLPPFPVWDDVRTFDGRRWRGAVDVVSGGFPCTAISSAGKKDGIEGEHSNLWVEMARIIREVGPRFAFVENSSALTVRGIDRVLSDLAEMGFDAEWGVLGAHHAGAPHRRERIWILADSDSEPGCAKHERESQVRAEQFDGGGEAWAPTLCDPDGHGESDMPVNDEVEGLPGMGDSDLSPQNAHASPGRPRGTAGESGWWVTEPDVGRVAHGVAGRVDRLRAIGNGQVPAVAALAWRTLTGRGGVR